MDKLLTFSSRSEKGIFTHVIDTERRHLEKTAAEYHPTVAAYINNAKPIEGKTQILLTALGAFEYWGFNANGDAFPEEALAHEGEDYGYRTFRTQAKLFRHHINKPTSESYGEVLLSVYNPVFHRVELVVAFNHSNAKDLVERVNSGESLDFSMGARVPYDVCSICGNKAPTRAQYCEHLKYYLGKIHPGTGKFAFAINTRPKFFDISYVLIGADRIAKSLKKVANLSANLSETVSSAFIAEKLAERLKAAEIKKEIPANEPPASHDTLEKAKTLVRSIEEVKAMEPPLPTRTLDSLAELPLPKVMSTMIMMGMLPKPQEFQRIYLISTGHRGLADALDQRNICFHPESADHLSDEELPPLDIGAHNFDERVMHKLSPFMDDRSYFPAPLGKRIVVMIKSGAYQSLPNYVKVAEDGERKPLGPVIPLMAAAGAYMTLVRLAPKELLKGIDKVLASNLGMGLAAALGYGLIKTFNTVAGPNLKGQYSAANSTTNPDANDVFARIEQLKQKPFNKVGLDLGSARKRLLGVPLAYMASGVLQKHKEISPESEEGRIRSFIRRNPDAVSAALIADAVLSAKGHPISSANLFKNVSALGKHMMPKFAESVKLANELFGDDLIKTADAQEFLSNALLWPLAMGKANLPGRVVGGLFDQAALSAGAKLLEKRKSQKQENKTKLT